MLDPDISTADARRLLSQPDLLGDVLGPNGWTRRKFLQAVGGGVLGGAAISGFGDRLGLGHLGFDVPDAFAATPIGAHDGIVINVVLYGGNDGLNTVVPYTNGKYYDVRGPSNGNLAIPASQCLPLDGTFGLHPSLSYTKQLWDAGQLAIVHGVGYPNPDLSHFSSMAIWMAAKFGVSSPGTGWVGRWLDGQPPATADLMAATIGSSVPLHLLGSVRRAVAVPENGNGMFGTGTDPAEIRMFNGLRAMSGTAGRGPWHDMFAKVMTTQLDLAKDVAPVYTPTPTGDGFVRRMTVAARLVNANLGFRVLDVPLDGFDTHDGQPMNHANLLTELDTGLATFFSTIDPSYWSRVTVVTMSEFGRTPYSNDSAGTDHGTSNVQFVIGPNVRGGHYGQPSTFDTIHNQWDRFDMTTDFRHVLGTVIDGWMGGGASTILEGQHQNLGFFQTGPGDPPPNGGIPPLISPPSGPTEYVSMNPLRLFDTRDGTGGRLGPLTAGEAWGFPIRGQYGVPADAVAVAINLTAVDATMGTYVTAWPGGQARPTTSNLNPVPGMAVPNLAIIRLGAAGDVNFYNNSGTVHLLADVVGYFRDGSSVGMLPLAPFRLLDTRDGNGKLGGGQTLDLQVAGRGGVSGQPEAVALNVTVTGPTAGSYLTVWPSGEPRPFASSVNMLPGQTVPNMVLARVGANGMVSIYNNTGATDVVVDVLGCFDSDANGRYVALSPRRVLDTRDGFGAPLARVAQTPLELTLLGQVGVPSSGVSGVMLNVTAVAPTANTFITVYPSGTERPLASNLNVSGGQVIPNMVLARLGPDGTVMMYNNGGTVDLVADVVGYFTD
ncbi:MAG: DUF1501 domain-containing protein [Ilumatobacteraceae bacterium]